MLKLRVITAVILLAILVPVLFVPVSWPFVLLTLWMVSCAAWEWGRLNHLSSGVSIAVMGVPVAVLSGLTLWLTQNGTTSMLPASAAGGAVMVAWVGFSLLILRGGIEGWSKWPRVLRLLLGIVIMCLAWWSMYDAWLMGINYLLSIFCLVWTADIAAYFGGKRFGKRKLAPNVSPNKSWEGVWSGLSGVALLGVAWLFADMHFQSLHPSVFTVMYQHVGIIGLILGCFFLAAMSVTGDLVESLIKRSVGAKDSSQLLPGHGGVLDRIDALLPVFPLAWALTHCF